MSLQCIFSRKHSRYQGNRARTISSIDRMRRERGGPRRRKWWLRCCKLSKRWASPWDRRRRKRCAGLRRSPLGTCCIREHRRRGWANRFATSQFRWTSALWSPEFLVSQPLGTLVRADSQKKRFSSIEYLTFVLVILPFSLFLLYGRLSLNCNNIICACRNKLHTIPERSGNFAV